MPNDLIWVDEANQVTGYGEKLYTHRIGQLHRAFSVFICDPSTGRILLQQRAAGKYHSGGKWSNSCCSHPYKGESWSQALCRCMADELGLKMHTASDLSELSRTDTNEELFLTENSCIRFAGRFHYFSQYEDLAEHEMDHVFVYQPSEPIFSELDPDPDEIAGLRWIAPAELDRWLSQQPDSFSSWFARAYQLAGECLKKY